MNRHIWLIPTTLGMLVAIVYGALGYLFYQIGQAPGFSFTFNPLFPVVLIGGLVIAVSSFRKWRKLGRITQ